MTKQRETLSFADALIRIAADMGWDWMERVAMKPVAMLRRASDPDHPHELRMGQALALDIAYVRETGNAPPLLSAFQEQLGRAVKDTQHEPVDPMRRNARLIETIGKLTGELSDALEDNMINRDEAARLALIMQDCATLLRMLNQDVNAVRDGALGRP